MMKLKAKISELRGTRNGEEIVFEIKMIGTCGPEEQSQLIAKFHSSNKWSIDITEDTLDVEIEHDE